MTPQNAPPSGWRVRTQRWLVVALFFIAFALAYLDRQILTLLIDPMRHSLGLTDTQIGLLQGLAFALCFAIGGIPLGWLVDNRNRVRIASGCVAIWSVATASSGLASTYLQLLAVRSLTALSEAGCSPAALSIFSDLFAPRQLPRVTAIYTAAPFIGGSASLVAGGFLLKRFEQSGGLTLPWAGHLEPWQAVFAVVGMPGLCLALLLWLVVREPARHDDATRHVEHAGLRDVIRFVNRESPYLRGYFFAYACILAAFFSLITWFPTFAIRSHYGTAASLGPLLGVTFLVSGLAGSLSGQWFVGGVSDTQIVARVMRLGARFCLLLVPAVLLLAFGQSLLLSTIGYAAMVFVISMMTSLMPIPLQVGVPNRMRGRVIGLFIFGVNVIGTGAGPVLVGFVGDHLSGFPDAHADGRALSLALAVVLLVCAGAGSLSMRRALNRLERTPVTLTRPVSQSTDIAR
ncbi:MFS family permease [Paraburkholderia sp. GAS199]|uniref:MFS transporter n=1 Tax=Paraburkholderia sp. GAS199 TaxID=3035126 RepID=UPI003D221153